MLDKQKRWAAIFLAAGFLLIVSVDVKNAMSADTPASVDASQLRVPPGFIVETAAETPLVQYPMMAGFDDRGRLFVAESAGENMKSGDLMKAPPNFIRMLEDTNGDGRFDKSTIFADKMTLPMGALWHRGALYVASPPSIWRLEDTDDDGVADKREVIVNSFGFSGNAASVHGCFLGPNGRLYWCDGRHGHEFIDENGNITSKGKAARIFSCLPDGSDVQVFCGGGMDNPVEVDFSPEGEMFGSVNILLSKPRVDCLMHWIDGGVYPRSDQEDCIAEFRLTGDLLPPMSQLGHIAVSGMLRYRSEQFGPEYSNNLFTSIFNTHKIVRSVVTRNGASFQTQDEDFLVCDHPDFHPTDIIEDADGSLLLVDTGGWFRIGCPTSQVAKPEFHGAIYRIRRENATPVEDPRGLKLNLASLPPARLANLLADRRPAVSERAIDLLAQRGDAAVASLDAVLRSKSNTVGERRNAVWALSRIATEPALASIRPSLKDDSESVRLAAAHSLGTVRDVNAGGALLERLNGDSPAVIREAATALGRIAESPKRSQISLSNADILRGVFAALEKASADRFLEHALIYAVIRMNDREATLPYLTGSNPQVRRSALIALDQMYSGNLTRELVAPLLDTDDPQLQQQTLAVISNHEGWAAETLSLLRSWLTESQVSDERAPVLRGFLLAQSADPAIQELVAESLSTQDLPENTRLLLLEVVHRANLETLPVSWSNALGAALAHDSADVRLQAIRTIQSRNLTSFDQQLIALARSENEAAELRIEATLATASRISSVEEGLYTFLVDQLAEDVTPLLRLSAARAIADAPLNDDQLLRLADRFQTAGPLAIPVLLRAFTHSRNPQVGLSLVSALDASPSASNLSADELANVLRRYTPEVQATANGLLKRLGVDLAAQQALLAKLAPLTTGGDAELGKEIFFGKKAACSGCHTIAAQGGKVGPDLTKIGAIRTGGDLLEAVALPSASFARGYRSYLILTVQGRVHTGIISRQTADTVYLRTAELAEIRIPRNSIEEMKESSVSIMPKGLEKTLSPDELRNLLAFLRDRK